MWVGELAEMLGHRSCLLLVPLSTGQLPKLVLVWARPLARPLARRSARRSVLVWLMKCLEMLPWDYHESREHWLLENRSEYHRKPSAP